MNSRLRSGFSFGIGMTVFLILKGLYIDDDTSKDVLQLILPALVAGVFSGLIAGWLAGTSLFSKWNRQKGNEPK